MFRIASTPVTGRFNGRQRVRFVYQSDPRSTPASGTFFNGKFSPLSLIQEEQVVS